ncbi:putative phage abortive infection protein [Ferruginibacter albus]|uniref:putative phage abortive infection protein n=1 Tax=Ferruginibacter albus TaxID=2875540 RepID=UPI001CC7196F|nr:putative phage abortive infection protein [Ferruginibacter albus]UAY52738.1 putative phage abortive infection protein [Ferruginibacter albus]
MKKKKDLGIMLAIVLLSLGLIMLFFPYESLNGLKLGKYSLKINRYGDLGAFVSGLTTPFLSIAAFILLYLTYKSQKQELNESKIILQAQNNTLQKQQFETTFFNLLNLHHSIVNSIDLRITTSPSYPGIASLAFQSSKSEIKKGRDCFLIFYEELEKDYEEFSKENRQKKKDDQQIERVVIKKAYYSFFEKNKFDLSHYFRNLYHIVKFVNEANIINKQMYISLLRAQLSSNELLLLFYNSLSAYGEKKFKPLIEKYHFLKNLADEDLFQEEHLKEYEESAYGKPS